MAATRRASRVTFNVTLNLTIVYLELDVVPRRRQQRTQWLRGTLAILNDDALLTR
jgi:hypothetical protein